MTAAYATFDRVDSDASQRESPSPSRTISLSSPAEIRFVDGDESALADLYDQHGSLVYSFCRRQLGTEGGRDATQEVFVAAWRSRHRFDPERGSIRSWLMGIAKNKVVDAIRYNNRRPDTIGGLTLDDGPLAPVERASVDQMADRMILAAALDELPDRARRSVELSFFGQLTHPEIAQHTGLPLGTVKSDIRRALVKLRGQLAGNDQVGPMTGGGSRV